MIFNNTGAANFNINKGEDLSLENIPAQDNGAGYRGSQSVTITG